MATDQVIITFFFRMFKVHGVIRRASTFNTGRINHLFADQYTHQGGRKSHDLHVMIA